jgi:hypothetical protein
MNTQHTPGPWEVRFNGHKQRRIATTSTPNRHIADVVPVTYDYERAEATMEANAQRIVACVNACEGINPEAVPELLESLDALIMIIDRTNPAWRDMRAVEKARAAITKATGRESGVAK